MNIAGITAEYNPFHTGHAYQVSALREQLGRDAAVAAVMSGNWVQQGRPAVTDKWTRTRMALSGGVDLVLELPTVWAASSAESFARGAVALMCCSGVVDTLCFGSETGELSSLQAAADCLDSPDYPAQLRRALEGGASFAAARQAAVERLIGPAGTALASPNNNLGWSSSVPCGRWAVSSAPSPSAGRGRLTTVLEKRGRASAPPLSCGSTWHGGSGRPSGPMSPPGICPFYSPPP